jgi:hypothetical protein
MCDYVDFAMMAGHFSSFKTNLGYSFVGFQPGTLSILEILLAARKYVCSTSQSPTLFFHPQR